MIKIEARTMGKRAKRGFTLIEILMGVAVIGILAAIAVPNHYNDLYRAQRVEAIEQLNTLAIAQKVYFSQHDVYASDFDQIELHTSLTKIGPGVYRGRRYTFTMSQPWGSDSWFCAATADLDGDPFPDVLVAYEGNE
jgi:prepilin-type N-terminal cleavage/methylation domain-containing protein